MQDFPFVPHEYPFNPFSPTQCVHAENMINEYLSSSYSSSVSSSPLQAVSLTSSYTNNDNHHQHKYQYTALSYIPNYKDISQYNLAIKYHQYHQYINMIIPNKYIYNINYFISKYHNNTINKYEWTSVLNETIKQFTIWKK